MVQEAGENVRTDRYIEMELRRVALAGDIYFRVIRMELIHKPVEWMMPLRERG